MSNGSNPGGGTSSSGSQGPVGQGNYEVKQGDCLSSLAYEHKLTWLTLWNHEKNQSLKRIRKTPNILMPGDVVWIPATEAKEVSCATEKRHTFVRKGVPERLNVRFLDAEGKPFANEPYILTIDGTISKDKLDGDGWLRVSIPPGACQGSIALGEFQDLLCCDLNLGHMDPISELSGVQRRLANLGYYDGPLDGKDNEQLRRGVTRFREAEQLTDSDDEDTFRNKLKERHGS